MNQFEKKVYWCSGDSGRFTDDLEKFRMLQSFCGHDLRSQIGAATGLLDIISQEPQFQALARHPHFLAAMNAANDSLKNLDEVLNRVRPGFRVVWVGADLPEPSPDILARMQGLEKTLWIKFPDLVQMTKSYGDYRPAMVFLGDRFVAASQLQSFVSRLGPQLAKIYIQRTEPVDSNGQTNRPVEIPGVNWIDSRLSWDLILRQIEK